MRRIVLASTSPYRKSLLERLGVPFETASPDIEESRLPGEAAEELVRRLAKAKAAAMVSVYPDALIIGSDQVAECGGEILGKPKVPEVAARQLRQASGRKVTFYTGLCLLDAKTGETQVDVVPFTVHFRKLTDAQIAGYLEREQPYNCAGSFKSEGLGIALFSRLEGDDPAALIGLPLIRLVQMFAAAGVDVLTDS